MILVTGPLGSGTTMLIQLFDLLQFKVFCNEEERRKKAWEFLNYYRYKEPKEFPEVIKHHGFCYHIKTWIDKYNWDVDHIFYILNDLDTQVAKNLFPDSSIKTTAVRRIRGKTLGIPKEKWRAMSDVEKELKVREFYRTRIGCAVYGALECNLPITIIHYQRFCKDVDYAYQQMSPVLKDITKEHFSEIHQRHIKLDLVHPWSEKRNE